MSDDVKGLGLTTPIELEPGPASNPDPITGAPGSHPVGTAIGSAGGAGTGAVVGAIVGGPVGAAVGAVAGAVIGAAGGHVASEALDPTVEMDYWRVNYMTRPYYKEGRSFGDYEAAYLYGLKNATTLKAMTFEEAEKAKLASGWTTARGEASTSWADVREAARDSWIRSRR